jgi:hypothetical protein
MIPERVKALLLPVAALLVLVRLTCKAIRWRRRAQLRPR